MEDDLGEEDDLSTMTFGSVPAPTIPAPASVPGGGSSFERAGGNASTRSDPLSLGLTQGCSPALPSGRLQGITQLRSPSFPQAADSAAALLAPPLTAVSQEQQPQNLAFLDQFALKGNLGDSNLDREQRLAEKKKQDLRKVGEQLRREAQVGSGRAARKVKRKRVTYYEGSSSDPPLQDSDSDFSAGDLGGSSDSSTTARQKRLDERAQAREATMARRQAARRRRDSQDKRQARKNVGDGKARKKHKARRRAVEEPLLRRERPKRGAAKVTKYREVDSSGGSEAVSGSGEALSSSAGSSSDDDLNNAWTRKKQKKRTKPSAREVLPPETALQEAAAVQSLLGYKWDEETQGYLWLIKWKGWSYARSTWVPAVFFDTYPSGKQRTAAFLKREQKTYGLEGGKNLDGGYFPTQYLQADRVIGRRVARPRLWQLPGEPFMALPTGPSIGAPSDGLGAAAVGDSGWSAPRSQGVMSVQLWQPSSTPSTVEDKGLSAATPASSDGSAALSQASAAASPRPALAASSSTGQPSGQGAGDSSGGRGQGGRQWEYLVKFSGLSYDESVWELAEAVEAAEGGSECIARFLRYEKQPPAIFSARSLGGGLVSRPRHFRRYTYPAPKKQPKKEPRETGEEATENSIGGEDGGGDEKQDGKEGVKEGGEEEEAKPNDNPVPAFANKGTLRTYQVEGLNWLAFNWHEGRNCILADEMGLGKTVQCVSFCRYLYKKQRVRGPFLVVGPLSTIPHWQREFEGWTDMNCIVYHGNAASRQLIREKEFRFGPHLKVPPSQYRFNCLVTTYETILTDSEYLGAVPWKVLIIDEAHRLKNANSKLSRQLRDFRFDFATLLTGTPIQNNLMELFTLLNFLEPQEFSSQEEFEEQFGNVQDSEQVKALHALLKPYLLRRMKEDVETKLPPREETLVEIQLTTLQKQFYKAIYEKNTEVLMQKTNSKAMPSLMNIAMQLRKCCNHPFLLKGVEDSSTAGMSQLQIMENLIQASGKLVLLDKFLAKMRAENHKVLIFSQMVRMLDILQDFLRFRGYPFERLDGNVTGSARQASIDRYSKKDSDSFVFLLCTRAGGVGINLTAADTVVIFDSDWNPQNDLQAQARCHRIGQTKKVKIYRMITKGTYEMQMFHKSSLKLGLDKAILHTMKSGGAGKGSELGGLSAQEVEDLLKHGAYNVFVDDFGAAAKELEQDIDIFLEKHSRVIKYGAEGGGKDAPSSFSTASFVKKARSQAGEGDNAEEEEEEEEEVDINDPDFWEKLGLKRQEPEQAVLPYERRRNRVQRLGLIKYGEHERLGESDEEWQEADESSKGGKGRGGKPEKGEGKRYALWSKACREAVVSGLSNFGFGRWEAIRRAAAKESGDVSLMQSKTDEELSAYSLGFIAQLCRQSNAGTDEASSSGGSRDTAGVRLALLLEEEMIKVTSLQGKRGRDGKGTGKGSETEEQDGDGRGGGAEDNGEQGGEFGESKRSRRRKVVQLLARLMTDTSLESPKFKARFERNAARVLQRMVHLHTMQTVVAPPPQDAPAAPPRLLSPLPPVTSRAAAPCAVWGPQHDRDLVLGVYTHGESALRRGAQAIKEDPTLAFAATAEFQDSAPPAMASAGKEGEEEERKGGEHASGRKSQWPGYKELTARFAGLMNAYSKLSNKLKRQKAESTSIWTRGERASVQRALLRYGVPHQAAAANSEGRLVNIVSEKKMSQEQCAAWAIFRDRAELPKKSLGSVAKGCRDFVSACVKQVEGKGKDSKNTKIVGEAKAHQLWSQQVTPVIARKVLDRLAMHSKIQHIVLEDPSGAKKKLRNVHATGAAVKFLPEWWSVGKASNCDWFLLKGVACHGLESWEQMQSDPTIQMCPHLVIVDNPGNANAQETGHAPISSYFAQKEANVGPAGKSESTEVVMPRKEVSAPTQRFVMARLKCILKTLLENTQRVEKKHDKEERKKELGVKKVRKRAPRKPRNPDVLLRTKGVTVLNFGRVEWDNPNFHTSFCIFPVGYKIVRKLASTRSLTSIVDYTGEILVDRETQKPMFRITASDDPNLQITKSDPQEAFSVVMKKANTLRVHAGKRKKNPSSLTGPELFGLTIDEIAKKIQELENADKCLKYIKRDFSFESKSDKKNVSKPEKKRKRKERDHANGENVKMKRPKVAVSKAQLPDKPDRKVGEPEPKTSTNLPLFSFPPHSESETSMRDSSENILSLGKASDTRPLETKGP